MNIDKYFQRKSALAPLPPTLSEFSASFSEFDAEKPIYFKFKFPSKKLKKLRLLNIS